MVFTSGLPPPWSLLPNESAPSAPPPDTAPPTRSSSPPRSTRLRPLCSTTLWMTSAHLSCTENRTVSWSCGSWRTGRGCQVLTDGSLSLRSLLNCSWISDLFLLPFSGSNGGYREEPVDHRLTEREWAEEWRHLDHVRLDLLIILTKSTVLILRYSRDITQWNLSKSIFHLKIKNKIRNCIILLFYYLLWYLLIFLSFYF